MLDHLAALAQGLSALIVFAFGYPVIRELRKLKVRQSIRDCGPQRHQAKSGTPTMGGILIVAAIAVTSLVVLLLDGGEGSAALALALFVMLAHGAIGFIDDYIKVVQRRNLGLSARQKLLLQIVVALVVAVLATRWLALPTSIMLPSALGALDLGLGYYVFVPLVLVGTTNAVNLTDGLDGLAAGTVAIAALTYAVVCYKLAQPPLAYFCLAMLGACLAFLAWNFHPAKVFMGDTGSLALGGALAAVALLTKTELLLILIGGVFVVETLSVIIQVVSYQTRGKRVFLMSPLHHHFELKGWSERRVVLTFWLAGVLCSALALWLVM